jgi:HKD family nuclease
MIACGYQAAGDGDRIESSHMVTVKALSNSDQALLSTLRSELRSGNVQSVRAAISFLMTSGTREVERDLKRLIESGVSVTIIFGDDFHLTQSTALASLMGIGCDLRLYVSETHVGYHPKMWLIDRTDQSMSAVVGSSNLSRGGLIANAEVSVLLDGRATDLAAFGEIWSGFVSESHQFTADDLKSYEDSEATATVRRPRKPMKARTVLPASQVRAHIERWQRYIADGYRIGRAERWRGWYLVPEQGQLTGAKLVEMSRVLAAIQSRPQHRREGWLSLGTDVEGVTNAVEVLRVAGVTTQHTFTDTHRRDLFVRQQRLYLQTFGWLEQLDASRFRVTPTGNRFRKATTARMRSRLFTDAIAKKKWPFGPIAFYPFLVEILERVPGRRLYYDEMNLIVIHSYHRSEVEGIVNLVSEYRVLDEAQRTAVHGWADQRLRTLLVAHAGQTAYGRYRRKIADLMTAFGSTTQVEFCPDASEDRSFIQLR